MVGGGGGGSLEEVVPGAATVGSGLVTLVVGDAGGGDSGGIALGVVVLDMAKPSNFSLLNCLGLKRWLAMLNKVGTSAWQGQQKRAPPDKR